MESHRGSSIPRLMVPLVLSAVLMTHCTTTEPAMLITERIGPPPKCPYKTIFVDPKNAVFMGDFTSRSNRFRQKYLELVPSAFARHGYQIVADRSDAWFTVQTLGSKTASGNVEIGVRFSPTVRLWHHIYIVNMNDEEHPFLRTLDTISLTELTSGVGERGLEPLLEKSVTNIIENHSEDIAALCTARRELVDEGWPEIEALRQKLVDEMIRIRREQREETQRRKLRISVEVTAKP